LEVPVSKYDQFLNAAQRPTGTLEVRPDESEAETSARLERSRAH
jgi:hypothetical protein